MGTVSGAAGMAISRGALRQMLSLGRKAHVREVLKFASTMPMSAAISCAGFRHNVSAMDFPVAMKSHAPQEMSGWLPGTREQPGSGFDQVSSWIRGVSWQGKAITLHYCGPELLHWIHRARPVLLGGG